MYYVDTNIRVRYAETDQMGFVYYGVYPQYYEVGRVELLRSLSLPYKKLEDMGYWLPVVNLEVNYKKPALYDDLITVRTIIKEMPSSKIVFYYKIFNQKEDLLNTGNVSLAFMNKITKKVCSPPDIILDQLGSKL